jgi:hypothetical protein
MAWFDSSGGTPEALLPRLSPALIGLWHTV